MSIRKSLLIFLLFSFATSLLAREMRYLARSPRALMMGDAFTALADDDYTLFYNPAALGKNSTLELTPINPGIEVTNVLGELHRFEDFPSDDAAAISSRVMGLPLYIKAGVHPSLKFGPFGLSLFASSTTSMVLWNAVHPTLDIDYRLDRGFVFGYAYTLGGGGLINQDLRTKRGARTSFGIAVKNINRQGLQKSFDLFGTDLMATISSGGGADYQAIRESLGYSKGKAWGWDIGMEHAYVLSENSELAFAASVLDVTDTRFEKSEGIEPVPKQDMYINLGMAWKQDFWLVDYAFTLDIHPVNEPMDFARKLHAGLTIGIPLIRLFGGWNGGYISYGAELNLWPIKIMAGLYGVEIGRTFKQHQGKRGLIYFTLFDFSFDA